MQTRNEHKPKLSCFLCKFWTCKLERMQHQDSSANHIELQRGYIYVPMCWIDSKARIEYLGFLKGQSKVQAAQTQRKISLIFFVTLLLLFKPSELCKTQKELPEDHLFSHCIVWWSQQQVNCSRKRLWWYYLKIEPLNALKGRGLWSKICDTQTQQK